MRIILEYCGCYPPSPASQKPGGQANRKIRGSLSEDPVVFTASSAVKHGSPHEDASIVCTCTRRRYYPSPAFAAKYLYEARALRSHAFSLPRVARRAPR
jgi:hypothetical protein